MRSAFNVPNLEVKKPNSSKLACKYSVKVVVSSSV